MRAIFARVLVALLMTSALVALRAGSGAHLAAPSREVSPRLLGREERGEPQREETNRPTRSPETRHELTPRRRLCVIASHRPRVSGSPSSPGEPERFAAYLASWLPRAAKVPNGAFSVWVVEQADEYRFNRGWLMNVGVAVSRALDACDVFALHDVDLLPVDARLPYGAFPRVREVLAPSEGDGGAEASRRIADRTVDAAHLSPPGVHPEYVFRTFKGGAWLFTWDALVRADGYAHVYWGWGLEDDDLGARALAANLSVATRPFPVSTKNVSSASRRDVSLKASRDQCTGFARACAFDPTRTDCLADVPYDSFKKRAFAKTPRTTREGLIVPEGRTLADGVCFAHAHEGTFSRDALETNARRHPRLSPEFTRGRRWEDVRSGRFRADETTGLARLTPAGVLGDEGRDANGVSRTFEKRKKNAPPEDAPPDPGHGFAVLGLDVVGVRVRRGVAIVANETRHPDAAVASALDDPALKNHRWSGNALLRRAFGTSASRERASSVADSPIRRFAYPAFTRLRVRLTCDEDATPWCVDATRDAWRANENETRGEKTR